MAVHGERRIRLVAAQHGFDRMARGIQLRIRKRPFAEQREAGRDEQRIALAHVEPLGEMQHHLAAGCARPDSTKLRWRAETSASSASAIWLSRRRCRHVRSSGPMPRAAGGREGEWRAAVGFMWQMIGNPAHLGHYL